MSIDKWFANLHNDPYLKGTRELEGMVFQETIKYLIEFVDAVQNKKIDIDIPALDDSIGPLLNKLDYLKQNSFNHEKLREQFKDLEFQEVQKKEAFTDHTNEIVEQLKQLNPEEAFHNSLLIAGGWQNTDGGHAMVYEFKKEINGDLLFLIHNSGAGLNYHHKIEGIDKERFCPVYAYRILKDNIQEDKLNWFLGELLKPALQLKNEKKYNAERLYQEILPNIIYLNGEVEDPFQHTRQDNVTAGQHSGTCAEKSLHQMLENAFPDKQTYQKFIYYFKKFALDKYLLAVENSDSLSNPGVLNQIKLAIENMSRLLLKEDYFDQQIRKTEADLLLPIKRKLNQHQDAQEQSLDIDLFALDLNQPELHNKKNESIILNFPKSATTPELILVKENKTPSIPHPSIPFNFLTKNLNDELTEFNHKISKLITHDPKAALISLEQVFLEWPLPPSERCNDIDENLKSLSLEERKKFLLNLGIMNSTYVEQYKKLHGTSIKPDVLISQLSFVVIVSRLNTVVSENDSLLNIASMALDKSLDEIITNPFLSSENPIIDLRLSQLTTLLTPQYSSLIREETKRLEAGKNIKRYYDAILKKHDLWNLFDKYYEKYCEINRISERERVADFDENDVRPLFLMKQFIELPLISRTQYIKALSNFAKLDIHDLTNRLNAAESEFEYQHRFEMNVKKAFSVIRENDVPLVGEHIIELNNRGYSYSGVSSPFIKALSESKFSIPKTLCLPQGSIIDLILAKSQLDANSIQVCDFIPKKMIKTKDIKWIREFLHLRSSSFLLPATIDFFAHNLNFLDKEQNQLYLEKNLFDPQSLIKTLEKKPYLIEQVNEFLEFGIQAYSKSNKPQMPALFFMKLDVKLCIYSIEYYQSKLNQYESESPEYKALETTINQLSERILSQLDRSNKLCELHADDSKILHQVALQKNLILSFLITQASSQKEKTKLLQPLISSLLTMHYYERKPEVENLLEKEKLEHGFRALQLSYAALAKENIETAEQLLIQGIKDSLTSLSSDFKKMLKQNNLNFTVEMPFVTIFDNNILKGQELLTINLNNGLILKPGLNKIYLPDDLKNMEWYKSLFKDFDPVARTNYDSTYFEFEHQEKNYRILKINNEYVLQKYITVLDQKPYWYQARNIKELTQLQTIFKENNSMAWVKVPDASKENNGNEQVILADKQTGKLQYCYQGNSLQLIQLDENGLDTGYRVLHHSSDLHQMMAQFEDPQFVLVLKSQDDYQIKLPRYNLTFEVKKSIVEEGWNIYLAGASYLLDFKENNTLIPGLKAPLILKSDKDKKILLPMQQFLVEADLKKQPHLSKTLEVYTKNETDPALVNPSSSNIEAKKQENTAPILEDLSARFDKKPTNNKVNNDETGISPEDDDKKSTSIEGARKIQISNKKFTDQSEYYNFILNTGDHIRRNIVGSDAVFNNYSKSEMTAEYALIEDQLIPKTMITGLYLVYVFLCSQQPEKAFAMLDYCEKNFHELSGTAHELDILKWIIFSTPAQLKDSKVSPKIETPEFLAVKLKSMYFLANFKSQNPDFKVPDEANAPLGSVELLYQTQMTNERNVFYKNLDTNIYALYHKYHHVQENIPDTLKLKNDELFKLLNIVYGTKKRQIEGPLGTQWLKLKVLNLHSELKLLEEKAKHYSNTIPEKLLIDIELIKRKLAQEKPVLARRSKIEEQKISIKNPEIYDWKFDALTTTNAESLNQMYQAFNKEVRKSKSNIDFDLLLRFPIDEKNFVLNFPRLCDAIYINSLGESNSKRLLEFCVQTIKINHRASNSKSNLPQLCNYLFVLMNYKNEMKKLIEKSQSKENSKSGGRKYNYQYSDNITNINDWMQNLSDLLSKISIKSTLSIKNTAHTIEGMQEGQQPLTTLKALAEEIKKTNKSHAPIPFDSLAHDRLSEYQNIDSIMTVYEEMNLLSVKNVVCQEDEALSTFFKEITILTNQYNEQRSLLKYQYENIIKIDDFIERTKQTSELDNKAGVLANELGQQKAKLCLQTIGQYEKRSSIFHKAKITEKKLISLCATQLKQLENFANQNFEFNTEGDYKVDLQLGLLGRKLNKLKLCDLLSLYLHNDLRQTMNATGLSESQSKVLHDMITEYLAYSIQRQQFTRICDTFGELSDDGADINDKSSLTQQQILSKLGQYLTEENLISFNQSPALTLFQYDQEILVRDVQKQFIESLMERNPETNDFSNKIIQLIMGGGKSKVILPILALQKANGENLSIIEVPEFLYKTNLADLNKISFKLFGQHAFGFHFTRQSSCDSLTLKKLFKQLKHTSVTKGYVVTTKESMASLNLKYHELLSNPPKDNNAEWQKQIKWLDRIINFRKTRGDLLIDEIDSSLYIRKQINYTVGEKKPVPTAHVNGVLNLYEFLNQIQYDGVNLLDLALNTEALSELFLDKLLEKIAYELVHNKLSPLLPYLSESLSEDERLHICNYLLNKSKTLPKAVEMQDTHSGIFSFKLLKGELSHFLPHTLSLKLYTNYGPSENVEKSLLERLITIPYSGNNDPQERSKDTVHIKTLNLTIQSTLETGLSPEVSEFILTDIIQNAKTELLNNPNLRSIDNTQYGKNINSALKNAGIPVCISKINPNDSAQMEKLTTHLKNNRSFIFYVLQEHILPIIEIDTKILVHTPINHIDMYRTAQGITGTAWNWRTMHQKIKFDELLSMGTDGLTIARLTKKNPDDDTFETAVHVVDYENPLQFTKDSMHQLSDPANFRAIIDIGATFRGVSNKQVALDLANYAKEHNKIYNTSIQYVLYFDKDSISNMDELYAIPIAAPLSPPISLKGKTSKEIQALLQCTPDNYFTYYDEKHKVGADIEQAPSAIALVTVDRKTLKKDFCQGVMRMRGFGIGQKSSVIISNETCKAMSQDKKQVNIVHVVNLTEKNQNEVILLQDHFISALQLMQNLVSNDLNCRILAIDDKNAIRKAELHRYFETFFTQYISEQFIDMYGLIEQEQPTKKLFKNQINQLIKDWIRVLKDADITLNSDELEFMKLQLKNIQKTALSYCDSAYLRAAQDPDQTSESQNEMHNQPDNDKNQDLDVDESFYEIEHSQAEPVFWTSKTTLEEILDLKDDAQFETPYWDRQTNKQCKEYKTVAMPKFQRNPGKWNDDEKMPYITSNFDTSIRRSYNFLRTARNDEGNYIAKSLQKQIHSVLMIQKGDELKCILLTFKEADHIEKILEINHPEPPNYIWITNTHDTKYSGKMPVKEMLNKNYERIIQQLKFYNGDLKLLSRSDLSGSWLMEEFGEKMQYFEDNLQSFRITDKQEFIELKKKMHSLNQAFDEVTTSPGKTFKALDFKQRYPLLNHSNIESIGKYHHFCQSMTVSQVLIDSQPIADEYTQPFYYKLILNCSDETLFRSYFTRLDDEVLQKRLDQTFELIEIKHNFDSINILFERPPFTEGNKLIVLREALNHAFTKKSFIENLLNHCSDSDLKNLLDNLDYSSKQKFIQAMSSDQIAKFVEKDFILIETLCNALGNHAFNEKVKVLGQCGVIIPESEYNEQKFNYDYLLKNQKKLHYFQSHSSKEYLKSFWNNKPLCEAFIHLCSSSDNEEYIKLFNEIYNLFDQSFPKEIEELLWYAALSLSDDENANKLSLMPLEFLKDKLSIESYFNTLKQDTNSFFSWCSNEKLHQNIDFFYQQLMRLNSDKTITALLSVELRGSSGWFYNRTLVDVMDNMDNKPPIYEQLNSLNIKAQLLHSAEKLMNHDRYCNISSSLMKYSSEFSKRPIDFIPLSQLRLDNKDTSSPLVVDIIQKSGDEYHKTDLNQALETEKIALSSLKKHTPTFFKNAQNQESTDNELNVDQKKGPSNF